LRAKPIITINRFSGINNQIDPVRMEWGGGSMPLVAAVNCDIDDSGMISLREGYTLSASGNIHSLWSDGSVCLFKSGGSLKALGPDLKTITTILTGLDPHARVSYKSINNDIYLTDNSIIGYVRDGAFNFLTDPANTFKAAMPAGHLIEYFNARLYVARDNLIFFSDPATYQYYDKRYGFIWLPGRVTLFCSVEDGIYVSDGSATYFMSGASPHDFSITNRVADYPALEGSAVKLTAEVLAMDGMTGKVAVWSSPKGICLGGSGGKFINLTQAKYHLFKSPYNTALARTLPGKHQYFFVSEVHEVILDMVSVPLSITTSIDFNL
jgi:hypothetical protein